MKLMVPTRPPDYRSRSWKIHKAVSFTAWYAGSVAWAADLVGCDVQHLAVLARVPILRAVYQPGAFGLHLPSRAGLVIIACLVCLFHPRLRGHQGGHWISYKRFAGVLVPLNAILYAVNLMPQSPAVNWGEWFFRRKVLHVTTDAMLLSTALSIATIGLAPLWIALAVARVIH